MYDANEEDVLYGYTEYLTQYYKAKLSEFSEKEKIDEFIESGKFDDNKTSKYVFTNYKRYGFLHKTLKFVNEPKSYEKNIVINRSGLTRKNPISIDENEESAEFINDSLKIKLKDRKQSEQEVRCRVLDYIWRIDEINGKIESSQGDFKKVFQLMGGREVRSNDILEKGKEKGYEFDLRSKQSSIKFAIAVGKEDKLDEYLKYSGFLKDTTYTDLSSIGEKYLDRTDILCRYALKYRDELIKEWWKEDKIKKSKEIGETEYENKIRDKFPFIKLLMLISRDIQFCTSFHKDIDKGRLESDLIYFVGKAEKEIWFEEYRKIKKRIIRKR